MKLFKERAIGQSIILALGFLAAPIEADTSSPVLQRNAAPTPPTLGDPFVKKDAPPVDETGPVSNVILTLESYTLSQADGAKLLQENDTDQARHVQVLQLVKAGKAHFDALLSAVARSGEQAVVDQVDVVPYAISFQFSQGKAVAADDFKKRNVGRRLAYKGQTTADHQRYDAYLFLETTTLKDFVNVSAGDGSEASQPEFSAQRVNAMPPYLPFDQVRFMGTYSPMPKDAMPQKGPSPGNRVEDSKMTLVFGKASQIPLDPGTLKEVKPPQFELRVSLYSMDRDKAFQILDQKQQMDSAYQTVQSLVKADQAKLEHTTVLRTSNGIKSNVDEVTEFSYSPGAKGQFITQDVGFSAEMKPFFVGASPLLTIDVTKCELINYVGNLHVAGVSAPYNETQPVFGLQCIVTQINSALGEHELLGTISPPDSTGANDGKDTGRVWLAFLQTTAVNP